MPIKTELTQLIAGQNLTALIQSLIANPAHPDLGERLMVHNNEPPLFGYTQFKESAYFFTATGAHADLETVMSCINEVALLPARF